mgnify:CR=1 FL=1
MDAQTLPHDLEHDDLRKLSAHHGPGLSVYVPLTLGNDQYNRVQLRSCLQEARREAPELGARLAKEVQPLLDDLSTWDKSCPALALFASDDGVMMGTWLTQEVDRHVQRGERFHITPIATMADEDRFVVVALQLGGWSAYEVAGDQVSPIDVDGPSSLEDATRVVVDPVPGGSSHGHHTGGPSGATDVHPQGFGHEDRRKNDAEIYFRDLSGPLVQAVGKEVPVVLVGNEPWIGTFARMSELNVVTRVDHNPGDLRPLELVDLARERLPASEDQGQPHDIWSEAAERSDDPALIASMARSGGVSLLLLPEDDDIDSGTVCDVVAFGGQVRRVERGELNRVGAVLRWPAPLAQTDAG